MQYVLVFCVALYICDVHSACTRMYVALRIYTTGLHMYVRVRGEGGFYVSLVNEYTRHIFMLECSLCE